jgi:hypothetical protein
MFLVRLATSIDETVDEIEHFYSNYQGFEIVGERGRISLRHEPTDEQIASLAGTVPYFNDGPGYKREDPTTISFNFDGRNYVSLRLLINEVNNWIDQD